LEFLEPKALWRGEKAKDVLMTLYQNVGVPLKEGDCGARFILDIEDARLVNQHILQSKTCV
jgi:hypothetical protein